MFIYLKIFFWKLKERNHKVIVTVKDIKSAIQLLDLYKIKYINLGIKKDTIFSKGLYQIKYDFLIYNIVKMNKINFGLSSSITLPHISRFTKMKSLVMDDDDDEVEPLFVKYGHPFADFIFTPDSVKRKNKKSIYYPGVHELAYLHPNLFNPDFKVLEEIGINKNERFFILRFNSFKAHHDKGVEGLSIEKKRKLILLLKQYGKIFITTEREIEPEFEEFKIKISPHKIHSFIYYATMLLGDSQTMTSEAAVLGTPAIRSNSFVGRISYLEEEEHKYGLTYGFKTYETETMFAKIEELLKMPDLKEEWQKRRQKMLADKIDVTAFIVWFIENFPESSRIMKYNPDYKYKFK